MPLKRVLRKPYFHSMTFLPSYAGIVFMNHRAVTVLQSACSAQERGSNDADRQNDQRRVVVSDASVQFYAKFVQRRESAPDDVDRDRITRKSGGKGCFSSFYENGSILLLLQRTLAFVPDLRTRAPCLCAWIQPSRGALPLRPGRLILPRTCWGLCPGAWERGCLAGWSPDRWFSEGTASPRTLWAPDRAGQCALASGGACSLQPRSPACPGHPQLRLQASPLLPCPCCLQVRALVSRPPPPVPLVFHFRGNGRKRR